MSFTFKYYIQNFESDYISLFKEYLPIDNLPEYVCSSKVIYNILVPELQFNTFKQKIFRETFSEYFKLKIHTNNNNHADIINR